MDKFDFMRLALIEAKKSADEGEVPVGAVIVKDGEVVAVGRNRREKEKNALCHAELEAIGNACEILGGWRLWQCEMYVTLEPCPMCAGAIINSRLIKVTYGADDNKNGAVNSVINMFDYPFTHKPLVEKGVLKAECKDILSEFFGKLREKRKEDKK